MGYELRNYYAITPLSRPYVLEAKLKQRFARLAADDNPLPNSLLKGTILLSMEGINVAICGTPTLLDAIEDFFSQHKIVLSGHMCTELHDGILPFKKLKIKTKKEVVALNMPLDLSSCSSLPHVPPQDWNALIQDPKTLTIDSRNNYEYILGHFENALNPETASFKEFPQFVDHVLDAHMNGKTQIALYCTGGIRCEKSSLVLTLRQRYAHTRVYQLEGGILAYLKQIPSALSLWKGQCFVFDDRAAIDAAFNQVPISPIHRQLQGYQAKKLSRYSEQSRHYAAPST